MIVWTLKLFNEISWNKVCVLHMKYKPKLNLEDSN